MPARRVDYYYTMVPNRAGQGARLLDTLRKAGVRFRSDVVAGPGGRQILVEDPSGNPVELFEPASDAKRS